MSIVFDPKAAEESRKRTVAFMEAQRFTSKPTKNWAIVFLITLALVVSGVRCCAEEVPDALQTRRVLAEMLTQKIVDSESFYKGARMGAEAQARNMGLSEQHVKDVADYAVRNLEQKDTITAIRRDMVVFLESHFDEQELADLIAIHELKVMQRLKTDVAPELLKSAFKHSK